MTSHLLLNGNALHIPLVDGSVQTCITSPPYWGLRDYGMSGQIGLEARPDCLGWASGANCGQCYVCITRLWAAEVWRVLRDDGTFWCNLGDSYGHGTNSIRQKSKTSDKISDGQHEAQGGRHGGEAKQLSGLPWRVALALQADGWVLRSDIIWAKPNPMPESVGDRPTKSHEYIFLMTKRARYYYDAEAVKEGNADPDRTNFNPGKQIFGDGYDKATGDHHRGFKNLEKYIGAGRNRRSVWTVATQPYSGAHFAAWPEALVEPMILAGTSERGCCLECGKPWKREVERERVKVSESKRYSGNGDRNDSEDGRSETSVKTLGWRSGCAHDLPPVPCTVLDPFAGSGTTGRVAIRHNRRFIGIDLNSEYLNLAVKRLDVQPVLI